MVAARAGLVKVVQRSLPTPITAAPTPTRECPQKPCRTNAFARDKGVVRPETTTYAHLGPEFSAKDAVVAAHQCVLENDATCDGAQFYWNQGIGVFWMATGNTE